MSFNTISVVGLGYVGLPTAAVFASRRMNVIGLDVNQEAIDTINRGEIHIVEPSLDIIVRAAVTEGYLRATNHAEPAEAFMIAVPTPFKDDRVPDLSYIQAAAKMIAPVLAAGNLVVLESTSPVGTTEQLSAWLAEERPDLTFPHTHGERSDIRMAHCPERVLPGQVIRELVENDRVIGGMTPKCSEVATRLYKQVVQGDCITTTARTAELAKLTENSFRDVNIAFANELSMLCDKLDINVWEMIGLANRHPRVNILTPGAGVGGHCIAVDPWFIVDSCPEEARIIRMAREINDYKPQWVLEKVRQQLDGIHADEPGKTRQDIKVACLGVAFKPNIDDLRESPALSITESIAGLGCQVMIVEPNIKKLPSRLERDNVTLTPLARALDEADVVCVLVKHSAFVEEIEAIRGRSKVLDVVGLLS
ncbi:UDP-N-acetyl-D-mannosamine dehydrogenase [Saccharospirillum salsuginis]|uniref:UDP-N-acetyl-D-mannosamine dehydrogenase n=1 Tax=Saccharospirillum salsuginis TaxID=418750 RepID=A0A918NBE4_9GAMM|nr:UDP-N-acetyl-D-mannosamine dehydrogenase [Saccharospirillum salsuginis]GGX60125.1 UDP-N-acetyl-D-mannosamine dehydrogenase [Saccharospirillum salsuginis]